MKIFAHLSAEESLLNTHTMNFKGMIKEALPKNDNPSRYQKNPYTLDKEALPQRGNSYRIVINHLVNPGKESLSKTTKPSRQLNKKVLNTSTRSVGL